MSRIEDTYADGVPRPPHWGGFLIRPAEIEFWADGEFRLHDRFSYQRIGRGLWSHNVFIPDRRTDAGRACLAQAGLTKNRTDSEKVGCGHISSVLFGIFGLYRNHIVKSFIV